MSYNIILEGCDCVGKSSIAEELMKMNKNFKLHKCSQPRDHDSAKLEYLKILVKLYEETLVIYDRAMLGERVYAPVFRSYVPRYMSSLEKLVPHNCYLFLITADTKEVYRRFDGKFIRKEQITTIKNRFKRHLNASSYPNKYIIDTTNISPYSAAVTISNIIFHEERRRGMYNESDKL